MAYAHWPMLRQDSVPPGNSAASGMTREPPFPTGMNGRGVARRSGHWSTCPGHRTCPDGADFAQRRVILTRLPGELRKPGKPDGSQRRSRQAVAPDAPEAVCFGTPLALRISVPRGAHTGPLPAAHRHVNTHVERPLNAPGAPDASRRLFCAAGLQPDAATDPCASTRFLL
jgi:hypothetical protein